MLRLVDLRTPILDLSWAVQSMIEREKLDFHEDSRFSVHLNEGAEIYSIKVKVRVGYEVRYEVGDTVKIRRSKGETCYARIKKIYRGDLGVGEHSLLVQVLVSYEKELSFPPFRLHKI